jgi:pimeloyl-ACP methyl ester carboxylesterase
MTGPDTEGVSIATVGDVRIAYETFGSPDAPPVLLIMGFASQMISWPDAFCVVLADRGHYVIRFDNRDVGLSTHLHHATAPNLLATFGGDFSSASYRLSDMAADAAGLLGALGLDSAHVVGMSLGGMIAQTMAIEHAERVRSLTSIMSTTGDPSVGQPSAAAMGSLMAPPATTRAEAVERNVAAYRVIASPAFPLDEEVLRDVAGRAFDRAHDPLGAARQLLAVFASGDRTTALRGLRVPTLVIHGSADLMIDVSGGRATAAAIPGAELVVIEGMGHDLSPALLLRFVDRISALVARAGGGGGGNGARSDASTEGREDADD